MNVIGKLLSHYRQKKGYTQKELAERLSHCCGEFRAVNPVTISRWETGTTSPGVAKKQALLHFLLREGCLDAAEGCPELFRERFEVLQDLLERSFQSRYQYIVGNYPDFGEGAYEIRPLAGQPESQRHMEHLLDIERVTNAAGYYTVTLSKLREWCAHPGTFGITCERQGQSLGHFLMLKVATPVAEEIAYHRRSEFDIAGEDLRVPERKGSYYIHALYGGNPRIAAALNVQAYLHMLRHFETIENVVIFSSRPDGEEVTRDYGIRRVAEGVHPDYGFRWYGMLSPVEEILFSENIVRTVF
jgi:transcriptional regulator with XRE-family HTH domain